MMNGIPAEVKFLACAQIWPMEDNSNLYAGVRLSEDAKYVAGDQVCVTHKEKHQTKTGRFTVLCLEKRKDKLYLIGTPDPEMPPPSHSGPDPAKPSLSSYQLLVWNTLM